MPTYDKPSPGLSIHLRYMHLNLDPASDQYLEPFHQGADFVDEEETYRIGIHRLPLAHIERHTMLWAPLSTVNWNGMSRDPEMASKDMFQGTGQSITQTEQVLLAIGEKLFPATSTQSDSSSNEKLTDEHHIYDIPLWQETTSVYFYLASQIPILRTVWALGTIWGDESIRKIDTEHYIERAIDKFHHNMMERPMATFDQAMDRAQICKKQADSSTGHVPPGNVSFAVAMYVRAITHLLPWCPSSYYQASWEMRLSGIGALYIKCLIDLSMALISGCQSYKVGYDLLFAASNLDCVTNWEMAKIFHWQSICRQRIADQPTKASDRLTIASTSPHFAPMASVLFRELRNDFLTRPPGRIATGCWVHDFEPESFRKHYLILREMLDVREVVNDVKEDRWYDKEETAAASNVRKWLEDMTDLDSVHEALKRMDSSS